MRPQTGASLPGLFAMRVTEGIYRQGPHVRGCVLRSRHTIAIAVAVTVVTLLSGCSRVTDLRAAAARPGSSATTLVRPPHAPWRVRAPRLPAVDCAKVKCVALTFDDGPGPYTARLLGHLARAGARATFFMLGQKVRPYAALLRRMVAEGHEVANHSWSHPDLTHLSSAAIRSQVGRTQEAIHQATGVKPKVFRPPYGSTNARVARAAGLPQILWSVDTLDWRYHSVQRNARVGVREPRRGGIVLFHDIHPASVAAIPQVLTGLARKGFRFVTVSNLLRGKKPHPGPRYLHR